MLSESGKNGRSIGWSTGLTALFALLFFSLDFCFGWIATLVISIFHLPPDPFLILAAPPAMLASAALAICVINQGIDSRLLSWLGFTNKKLFVTDLATGFATGALVVSLMIGAIALAGGYHIKEVSLTSDILPAMLLLLVAAINEELIFRGFLFQIFERSCGTVYGLIIASLIFGFAHMINDVPGISQMGKVIACLLLSLEAGVLLNAAFVLKRSLWLPIGIHWAWNFFEGSIFGASVSGRSFGPSLIEADLTGGIFAGGGPFGPEASLPAAVVGLMFGLLLLYVANQKGRLKPPG